MTTLNLSLPDTMKEFVEKQVEQGGYSSSSEYVRALVRKEQQRFAKSNLETNLLEGIASGPSSEMTAKDWADLRRQIASRAKPKRRK